MKEKYYVVAKTISRWKLDNWFENWLGYKADNSEFWKNIYVLYYRLFDNTYYKGGLKLINKEIERQRPNLRDDFNLLSDDWIRKDMIYSLHRYGVALKEYFIFKFYEKNRIGREHFTSMKLQYGYCEILGQDRLRKFFDDKGESYNVLKRFYKRDVVAVYGKADFMQCEKFFDKHSSFIFKPIALANGRGIKIYRKQPDVIATFLRDSLLGGAFVLEELIQQAEEMSQLHSSSINTVRLSTFRIGDEVHVYGAALRMGSGGSEIDNAGSGGLYAGIDIKYGIVYTQARDDINNFYTLHPDTKVKIVGFEIPKWNELLNTAMSAAKQIEDAVMIAWDFAYSDKGWCVVEANDVGGQNVLQGPSQIGIKAIVHNLIDKHLEYNK